MRTTARSALVLASLLLAFVSAVQPALARVQRPVGEVSAPALYDLERDERLGGHTLERHVGRSDADLAERLRREPQTGVASTYTDVTTARRVVAAAIAQSRERIRAWESRRGNRPNLVIDYMARGIGPIGRSLSRRDRGPQPCQRARVVLRWLERERRWMVLTSYPEAGQ